MMVEFSTEVCIKSPMIVFSKKKKSPLHLWFDIFVLLKMA